MMIQHATSRTKLIAAPFTPFHGDGSLNASIIEQQVEALVRGGVDGAFVCGTTGEGPSLTIAERMEIAERWCALRPAGFHTLIHVGHSSLGEARTLAAHARKIQADAIAAVGPFYFKPTSAEQLAAFCGQLASAAPDVPFYYYHIPSLSGVMVRMSEFLPIAAERIPTFAGIKFTHEDLMDYAECLAFAQGRLEVLFGRDEILLAALALGARGAVGSTYNFCPAIYRRLINAFESGDMAAARAEQAVARRMIAIMVRYGGLAAGKTIMKLCGIDCGPPRSPLTALSPQQENDLRWELDDFAFFTSREQLG